MNLVCTAGDLPSFFLLKETKIVSEYLSGLAMIFYDFPISCIFYAYLLTVILLWVLVYILTGTCCLLLLFLKDLYQTGWLIQISIKCSVTILLMSFFISCHNC